jgi:hypothetical protein
MRFQRSTTKTGREFVTLNPKYRYAALLEESQFPINPGVAQCEALRPTRYPCRKPAARSIRIPFHR